MQRPALLLYAMVACLLACSTASAMDHAPVLQHAMTITGEVKNPLKLTVEDLARFQSVEIQLNEVSRDRQFHGVYLHQAVPLRTLLDMAEIVKQDQPFEKEIDLAIRVTGASGKQVVLSWGEIYYSNAAEVAIAFAATPVKPMMTEARCQKCHGPEIYQTSLEQYARPGQLPKLLIRSDFYTDRCLEGVTRIEVIDLHPAIKVDRKVKLQSDELVISGAVEKELKVCCLKKYPQIEVRKKVVGVHMGYHGLHNYVGTPLVKLLEAAGAGDDLTKALLISAPDGYRALFSFGELQLADKGQRIILAKSVDGKLLKGQRGGKFRIIVPDELVDDRDVLAVDRIEVIDLKPQPKISVIGVGPGDTDLITLEAIGALARADVLVAPADIVKRFAPYLGDKPNLFDPLLLIKHMFRKAHPDMDPTEAEKVCNVERTAGVAKIRQALDEGKNVAFLDWGDPQIFGSSRWIREYLDEAEIETVAGLSSFNAANAVINRDVSANGAIVLTAPKGLRHNRALLEAVAKNGETLAIFMGIHDLPQLVPLLQRHYADATPVRLVYDAGIRSREHQLATTLGGVLTAAQGETERFLGLIYIGPCLAGE